MAAAANNKEESAVMVRTDWRRKVPPENFLSGIYLVPINATSYRWTSPFRFPMLLAKIKVFNTEVTGGHRVELTPFTTEGTLRLRSEQARFHGVNPYAGIGVSFPAQSISLRPSYLSTEVGLRCSAAV
jgi:hypothetical protein